MAFSLAAIPLPVLVGVPIVGVFAAIIYYEYAKHQAATAALAAPPPPPLTPVGVVAAAAAPPPAQPVNLGPIGIGVRLRTR